MNFSFPFDVNGMGFVREKEVVMAHGNEYVRLLNLDCDGGYYRLDSEERYNVKERVTADKYLYEVSYDAVLLLWSDLIIIESLKNKALYELTNNKAVVKSVMIDKEKIMKSEGIEDGKGYQFVRIVYSMVELKTYTCDIDLQCNC